MYTYLNKGKTVFFKKKNKGKTNTSRNIKQHKLGEDEKKNIEMKSNCW